MKIEINKDRKYRIMIEINDKPLTMIQAGSTLIESLKWFDEVELDLDKIQQCSYYIELNDGWHLINFEKDDYLDIDEEGHNF